MEAIKLCRLDTPIIFIEARINRSEERFSRNAETDIVCRLLLEKKKSWSVCTFAHAACILIMTIDVVVFVIFFFCYVPGTTEIFTLSLHDALPILIFRLIRNIRKC